jgi:hypothetical protein
MVCFIFPNYVKVNVLVVPPTLIFKFVPSYQMSPSLGEVGAVPFLILKLDLVVEEPVMSTFAVGVETPNPFVALVGSTNKP